MNRAENWRSKGEKPPGVFPAARCEGWLRRLGFDRVAALAVLALGRRHRQAHFLPDGAGQKAAHGMRLPARGFHQFLGRYAPGALQQGEDGFSLATLAHPLLLGGFLWAGGLGFGGRFGRFLGWGGLLGRLGLLLRNVGALWRDTRLLGGFRLLARRQGWGAAVFFCNRCIHVLSFGGDYRVHDMDHSGAPGKQVNSVGNRRRRWNGDGCGYRPPLAASGI